MFKTVEDLKSFILWAKEQQIESFTVDGVSINVSNMYFTEKYIASQVSPQDSVSTDKPVPSSSKRWLDDPEATADDEELLMWSSGG